MKALMATVDELNKSVNAYAKYNVWNSFFSNLKKILFKIEKQKYDAVYNNLMQKRVRACNY